MYSLHSIAADIENYETKRDKNTEPKILLDKSVTQLNKELLKNEIHNNDINNKKQKINNMLLKELFDTQKSNISDLHLENEMLRTDLEKYKSLYYELEKKLNFK